MTEPTKWEYKWDTSDNRQLLNQFGAEGWELIGAVSERDFRYHIFYFKRPLKQEYKFSCGVCAEGFARGPGSGWCAACRIYVCGELCKARHLAEAHKI